MEMNGSYGVRRDFLLCKESLAELGKGNGRCLCWRNHRKVD